MENSGQLAQSARLSQSKQQPYHRPTASLKPLSVNDLKPKRSASLSFSVQTPRRHITAEYPEAPLPQQEQCKYLSGYHSQPRITMSTVGRECAYRRSEITGFTGISAPLASMVKQPRNDRRQSEIDPTSAWKLLNTRAKSVPCFNHSQTRSRKQVFAQEDKFMTISSAFDGIVAKTSANGRSGFKFRRQLDRCASQKQNRCEYTAPKGGNARFYDADYKVLRHSVQTANFGKQQSRDPDPHRAKPRKGFDLAKMFD